MTTELALQIFNAVWNEETNWQPVSLDNTLELAVSALMMQDGDNVEIMDTVDIEDGGRILAIWHNEEEVINFVENSKVLTLIENLILQK